MRAWILHSAFNLSRFMHVAAGTSIWLSESQPCSSESHDTEPQVDSEEASDCVPFEYNVQLVNEVRPSLKQASLVLLICSALLDLLIVKWRNLADYIFYMNCITTLVTLCFPSKENLVTENYMASVAVIMYISYYTDKPSQHFVIVFQQTMISFAIDHFIYQKKLTMQIIVLKVFLIIAVFFICSILSMLLQYTM